VQIKGDGDRSQRPLGVDQDQLLQTIEELPSSDRVVVIELSRLGRSLGQIIPAVDPLLKMAVGLIAIQESIRLEGRAPAVCVGTRRAASGARGPAPSAA
jgi:DNA invertase Pin-like site-specific DNA recombinase